MDTTEAPRRRVTAQHRVLYAFYRLSMVLVRLLPVAAARRIGRGAGHLYRWIDRRRWRLTLDNLDQALPDVDPASRQRIANASFAAFGAALFDATVSIHVDPARMAERFEVVGWEHIEAVERRGTGYAVMSAHWGSWEAVARYLGVALGELHIISRPPTNPLLIDDFRDIRRRYGHHLVHKRRAGHRMLRLLKSGRRVGILIDQRVRPKDGILEPFLGRLAWTSPLLAFLAIKTRSPVVPVYCEPIAGGRYRLRVEPPIEPDAEGPHAAAQLTRAYLASVERVVRDRPELWMWMHRRWQRSAPVKGQNHVERYRGKSGLPESATFSTWPREADPTAHRAAAAFAVEATVEHGRHALVWGPNARHLGAAIGHALTDAGHEVRRVDAPTLASDLAADEAKGDKAELDRRLDVPALLVIDELDAVAGNDEAMERLRAFVMRRHGRRATVLVSAVGEEPWRGWLDASGVVMGLS